MDHVRIDPKFRRRPRPKRAGWAARQVFKFLLEVSAEFDLRGRLSPSMQDVEWLTEEWANGDEGALHQCSVMLTINIPKLVEVGLLHQDGDELVISDWDDFYKPSKTGAQRQADYVERKRQRPSPVTPVTTPVTSDASDKSDATEQHYTAQHSTARTTENAPPPPPPVNPISAPGALNVPAVAAGAMPERRAVARVERPDTPPEEWEGLDFWRWAQDRRQATGYTPERLPHPRKVSAWWSEARGVVRDVKRLKAAFYRYGEDKFWGAKDPPYPFAGFMSQWERFVPATEDSHAA